MIITWATKAELKIVASLSKMFAEENCCNGIVAQNENYFKNQKVIVAKEDNKIIGYAYGNIETALKNRCYINKGDIIFYLEEIYVIPNKRNLHVGEKLFRFLESYAKEQNAKAMEVSAVSKDYNRLLDFYINKLKMTFFSAFLYKTI